jgi:hypothetical protein
VPNVTGSLRQPRRVVALAAVGASLAAAAVAGTGIANAGDAKPPPPTAATQNLGAYSRVVGPTNALPAGRFAAASVVCPEGQLVLGGGESNSAPGTVFLTDSFPLSGLTSWQVYVKNTGTTNETFAAYAICGT